jgi:uncharacterized protein YukE
MKKIYLDEIENSQNEMVNLIEKEMKERINELRKLTDNLVWQGRAYNSYITNYSKKMDKLDEFNMGLIKIIIFLSLTKDDYEEANTKINNAYEELLLDFKKMEE